MDKNSGNWRARQSRDGKRANLGRYSDFDDAVLAKYKAEIEDNYYACLNGESSAYNYLKERGLLPTGDD